MNAPSLCQLNPGYRPDTPPKDELHSYPQAQNIAVFLASGDHRSLLSELQSDPLIFDGTRVWVIPYELESSLATLRLDSKVYLYEGNQSAGYTVYEGYAVRGGVTIIEAGPYKVVQLS